MIRRRDRSDGQGLVEFALVVPVLLLLILGIVDFARGIFIYSVVQDAAREGARYAIVHGSQAEALDGLCASGPGAACDPSGNNVKSAAAQFAIGLDPTALTTAVCWGFACTISPDCTTATNSTPYNTPLTPVTVATCYDFRTIASTFLPISGFGLRATATLIVNH